jgi:hypothetical protein
MEVDMVSSLHLTNIKIQRAGQNVSDGRFGLKSAANLER